MDVDPIVSALKSSPVYVAPGASTSPTVKSDLAQQLSQGDNIKIVLVPKGSDTPQSIASAVGHAEPVGTTVIVGEGDAVAVASTGLPSGVAEGLLEQADNVSTNGTDTITTLVGNIHDYQTAHPQVLDKPDTGGGFPFGAIAAPAAVIIFFAAYMTVVMRRKRRRLSARVSGSGPRELRPLILDLMDERRKVQSQGMRNAIENLCSYSEAFYERVDDAAGKIRLHSQLNDARQIAATYVDIEQHPDFYTDANGLKSSGRDAINGLAGSVLDSIKAGSGRRVMDFKMNSRVLEATRYK